MQSYSLEESSSDDETPISKSGNASQIRTSKNKDRLKKSGSGPSKTNGSKMTDSAISDED